MFVYPQPLYVACPECGACVPRWEAADHLCDKDRWVDYQMVKLSPGMIALWTSEIPEWLASPQGEFEQQYAARDRLLGRVLPLHPELAAVAA